MALYRGTVNLSGLESGFNPENIGSIGQVLTKTATGYNWQAGGGGGGSGDVVGPSSSTDGHVAVFDGVTGKLIKDGGELPTSFSPGGTATTGYVVTKTANGYEWAAPTGVNKLRYFALPTVGTNVYDLVSVLYGVNTNHELAIIGDTEGHTWVATGYELHDIPGQTGAIYAIAYGRFSKGSYSQTTYYDGMKGLKISFPENTMLCSEVEFFDAGNCSEYIAGDGLIIGKEHRDSQGPCPDGYHIPSMSELDDLMLVWNTLFQGSSVSNPSMSEYFKMPLAGHREDNWDDPAEWVATAVNTGGTYRSSYAYGMTDACGLSLTATGQTVAKKESPYWTAIPPQSGCFIRPFRDTPIAANEIWTTLYDGSSVATGAGIFHSPFEGIISISADGTNWITIADKNVGATTVWNLGDTLSESNTGNTFQWGNNYTFPSTLGSLQGYTVSVNRVDASGYGPGNYYSDDTIILPGSETGEDGWDSSENTLLWGGESTGIRVSNGGGNTIASKNGVLVFDVPQVGDDISNMINYLNGGGGALIKGSNGLYYTVTEYGEMRLWGRAFHRTINLLPTYNYVEIWHDGGIVSSIEYRQTDLLVNPPGQNGQVLTKTGTGSNKWTTPSIIISDQANNILQNGTTLWCGTEGDYANLGTYSSSCIYLTVPGGASPQFTPSSETPVYLPLSHSYINYGYSGNAVSYGTASFEEKDGADCLLLNPGYLEVDTSNSTIFSSRRTLNFWVNCTSITSPQATFVGKGNGNAEATLSLYVDTSSGKLMLNNADETKQYSTLSANTWYNIVVTHNASTDETKVYINSTLISTDTLNLSPKDNVLKIGETWNGQSGSKFYISRFILQSGIRTAQNVTDDYNGAKGYYGIS